ncbi:MAG: lytic transglycosylase domain-containing protein [Flavobacteriaceae bacterium]|nr:lytic transglycosylase domain-containing protein [Flavobacteriaceae bacterium]
MRSYFKVTITIVLLLISGLLINATQQSDEKYPGTSVTSHDPSVDNTYRIKAIKIPEQLSFAGEKVPLDNPDVRERMDRELLVNTYWQSNGLLWIKRAHKYFPIIEPILKRNGVPDDFKYLAVIESDLLNVTSPAGAKGFWQLLRDAARENGLEVNENVDERYHLEKATEAACKYIKNAKEKFSSWTLAAAAYHAGNYGLDKRLEEQMVSSYYDVLAGEMTERYVFRILAAKEILNNPNKYGFYFDESDLYSMPQSYTVKVDTTITNIAAFAKKYNTYYKELKTFNPWLRENTLNNRSGKVYYIKIPKE